MKILTLAALSCLLAFALTATPQETLVDRVPTEPGREIQIPSTAIPPLAPSAPTLLQTGPIPTDGTGDDDGNGGGGSGGNGGNNYVCQATLECPALPGWDMDPYTLTCQGYYSCSSFPSSHILCDGMATICLG